MDCYVSVSYCHNYALKQMSPIGSSCEFFLTQVWACSGWASPGGRQFQIFPSSICILHGWGLTGVFSLCISTAQGPGQMCTYMQGPAPLCPLTVTGHIHHRGQVCPLPTEGDGAEQAWSTTDQGLLGAAGWVTSVLELMFIFIDVHLLLQNLLHFSFQLFTLNPVFWEHSETCLF